MNASHDPHHNRRWLVLAVLGLSQLMVVLDATIVNIALPEAQASLAFDDGLRQWIVTAYALAFGGLLLLGGRVGDIFGRKRAFITGLVGFAVASAIGGAAGSFGVLVFARALQGLFGALLAPAALGLLSTTFTDPVERGKAFGVFGAIAGVGAAVGLLLGGMLTEWLSWRWCMYVNLAFALPAAVAATRLLHNQLPDVPHVLDIPGTITSSAGLLALVYGVSHAEQSGWGNATTVGLLAGSIVLLIIFVLIERRVEHPLLPMRVVLDRQRGASFLAMGIAAAAMFGVFLFLTYYLQGTLGYTPIKAGLAFLPISAAIMVAAGISSAVLLPTFGPRPLVTAGMLLAMCGMLFLTQLEVDSTYVAHVLPGIILMGAGMGPIFASAMYGGTLGVSHADAGIASAMVNTSQQVGGSIGVALLSTLAASATSGYLTDHPGAAAMRQAPVEGFTTAFAVSAVIFAIGAVVCGTMYKSGAAVLDPDAPLAVAH